MRPGDQFEQDLDHAMCGSPITPDQMDLARLRSCLCDLAASYSRTDSHQQWAWTRLTALTSPSRGALFSPRWFAAGATLALGLGLALTLLPSSPSPTPKATIVSQSNKLHAVPFHSKRANADVIWVDGYDYLPASYPLR